MLGSCNVWDIKMASAKFATTINCIDGRTQLPVINYLKDRFGIDYVDVITEPAPVKIIAESKNNAKIDSIRERLKISQEKHGSAHLAIVAHHDCAGNPVEKDLQLAQLKKSLSMIRSWEFKGTIVGLWVNENWMIQEIDPNKHI
ncbi:MAG: hypothetical protein N3A69_13645 [Leptospiraceae bacterium]|nr:hypothetical protein [Leptospiraceae bacterium]